MVPPEPADASEVNGSLGEIIDGRARDAVRYAREKPVVVAAVAIGLVILAWLLLGGERPPPATEVISRVNAHYASVGAVESTMTTIMPGQSSGVAAARTTTLERGRVTAFWEDFPPSGPDGTSLRGLVTADGNWLTLSSRDCWTPSGGPEVARGLGIGDSPIPADAGTPSVTAEDGRWVLTVERPNAERSRITYRIDPDSGRIISYRQITTAGTMPGTGTEIRFLREHHAAPPTPTVTALCDARGR